MAEFNRGCSSLFPGKAEHILACPFCYFELFIKDQWLET